MNSDQNILDKISNILSKIKDGSFTFENFKALVVSIRQEKKINEEYKNYKLQAGEKALSKSEWLTQRNKS